MLIEKQFVILPKNEEIKIGDFFINGEDERLCIFDGANGNPLGVLPQHIYILSDEKIKDGDFVFSKDRVFGSEDEDIIFQYDSRIYYQTDFGHKLDLKKIIVTTDDDLIELTDREVGGFSGHIRIPEISNFFLKEFFTEYNNKNINCNRVFVECSDKDTLVISEDNVVNVYLVLKKEMIKNIIRQY